MPAIWERITQTTLNNLKATGFTYVTKDNDLNGFGIKVTAKGQATYIVVARIKGGRTTRITRGGCYTLRSKDARQDAVVQSLRIKKVKT